MNAAQRTSLHTHTCFSDGENTPREMIEAALKLGFSAIGFTDHSYTAFDESYCIPKAQLKTYRETVLSLKEEYAGRIEVRLGIEQDYFSAYPAEGFDYVIGSVHYVKAGPYKPFPGILKDAEGNSYIPVDESLEVARKILARGTEDYFSGDVYALTEAYFREAAGVVEATGADIIGHFDVITKCNTQTPFFDETHFRYRNAWMQAADRLLATGKPFEINLSPVLKGIRKEPYPSKEMQAYLKERGGSFVLTGDCHSTDALQKFAAVCAEGLWAI